MEREKNLLSKLPMSRQWLLEGQAFRGALADQVGAWGVLSRSRGLAHGRCAALGETRGQGGSAFETSFRGSK